MFDIFAVVIGKIQTSDQIGYMSKITWTQNLGVSRWRPTSCATIGPESCLVEIARGKGYQESCPCTVVASFGLRHRGTPNFLLCLYPDADVKLYYLSFVGYIK